MSAKPRNALGQWMDSNGLTADEVATRLTTHLGREVRPLTVNLRTGKARTPPEWAQVLGIDTRRDDELAAKEVEAESPRSASDAPPFRSEDEPPRKPGGDTHRPSPPGHSSEYTAVRDRIAKAYGAIGAGVSMVTQNDGYSAVATVYSDDLANAWVAAARENQNVAKIIQFLESGGPVGELIIAHLILIGGFVYVSGRGPALDFLYAGKFGPHRALAIEHGVVAEAQRHDDEDEPDNPAVFAVV